MKRLSVSTGGGKRGRNDANAAGASMLAAIADPVFPSVKTQQLQLLLSRL